MIGSVYALNAIKDMTKEISKNLMCISMRSGVEIWVEGEKAELLQDILENISQHKFIRFEDQTFNTADLVGVFSAGTMGDATRRKNNQWQCHQGTWHEKSEKCGCASLSEKAEALKREEAIKKCGKCRGGFIVKEDGSAGLCDCQK